MAKAAPEGYEDRYGFHLGKPQSRRAIGHTLRQVYSTILTQPMPRHFSAYTRRPALPLSEMRAGPKPQGHVGASAAVDARAIVYGRYAGSCWVSRQPCARSARSPSNSTGRGSRAQYRRRNALAPKGYG